MKRKLFGECLAEAIGTLIFVLIGIGAVAVMVATDTTVSYFELSIVWGLAVSLGIYIAGFGSGAHLNPAVTISLACWKKFPAKKVFPYIVAQMIGAFGGAAIAYGLFSSNIRTFEQANNIIRGTASGLSSSGIFATLPGKNVSLFNAFFVEFVITLILMLIIYSVTDTDNSGAPSGGLAAIAIGLTVTLCGLGFGTLTGFAMNPARDLGPRLFTMLAGWGIEAAGPSYYGFIVPIAGPILGAITAGFVYLKLIKSYYPEKLTEK